MQPAVCGIFLLKNTANTDENRNLKINFGRGKCQNSSLSTCQPGNRHTPRGGRRTCCQQQQQQQQQQRASERAISSVFSVFSSLQVPNVSVLSAFLASANARTRTEHRHAFYVTCVGQNAVSRRVVQEMCLRSFCVGLLRETRPCDKKRILCVKTSNANFRKACSHAFYVACVGQHPVSVSSVCELCLRSVCLTPI